MGKAAAMNIDTTGNGRASLEDYGQICYDQQEAKNRNLSGSQNLASPGEDESRVNDVGGNIRNGPGMEVCARDLKIQPQQTPGPIINWERFLPVKSVKVLLVESDDSTRHVVSALLRNCSYEVTAVAHGLQAWRTLQDASSHIDLVLTEVVMPFLSGMDLLCKIMGHKTLKNIPVIMMSSHDSMGIVFKCLSKGAVDFLAKPIRKNELKNLWQHVWRRSYSLSGSGSGRESGTQAEQPANLRIANDSESNTSNKSDENGNGSNGLSIQNCSGDGSGTETSFIKKAAESKHASLWDQRPESDAPDSICVEVIYVGPEKHHNMDDQQLDIATGKDVRSENPAVCKGMKMEDALSEVQCKKEEKGRQDQEHDTCGKLRSEGFNVGSGGRAANCSIPQPQNTDCNGVGTKRKNDQGGVHNLELTLKRLHAMADDGNAAKNDHNILRHSDLSAFSKYNTMTLVNRGPLGNKGNSPLDNGSDAMRSGVVLSAQESNGSTKNNQLEFKSSESLAFQPVQNGNQKASSKETEHPSKASPQKVQVQHYHHHHHHHHYHHHHQTPDLNENISEPAAAAAPPCRSSNLANGIEENGGNVSGGGSNHGSDGNNNGSNNTPSGGDDTENGTTKNSGSGCGFSGNPNSSAMDDVRAALREAALTKFRQKRKERCFDKKVRYQSRKKLAEQRPRIKGQFVKKIKSEGKSGEERLMKDSCDTDR